MATRRTKTERRKQLRQWNRQWSVGKPTPLADLLALMRESRESYGRMYWSGPSLAQTIEALPPSQKND